MKFLSLEPRNCLLTHEIMLRYEKAITDADKQYNIEFKKINFHFGIILYPKHGKET